jgi:hypothetical protein
LFSQPGDQNFVIVPNLKIKQTGQKEKPLRSTPQRLLKLILVLLPIGHRRRSARPASGGGMLPEIFIYVLTSDLFVFVFSALVVANSAGAWLGCRAGFRRFGRGTWSIVVSAMVVSTTVVSTVASTVVSTTAVSISVDADSAKA